MHIRIFKRNYCARSYWHFKPILCLKILRHYYLVEHIPLTRKDIQILLVQVAYFLGFSPISYNSRYQRFWYNKNSLSYPLFLILYLTVKLTLVLKQLYILLTYGFHIQRLIDVLPWFFAFGSLASGFLYISAWFKNKEFTEFLNKYNIVLEKLNLQNEKEKGLLAKPIINHLVVKVFIPSVLFIPFISILVYYMRCEVHYLGSLIPVCEKFTFPGQNRVFFRHNSKTNIFLKMLYYFLQPILLVGTTGSIFIYIVILLPIVSEGYSVMGSLRTEETSHKQNHYHIYFWYKLNKWVQLYRSVFLIIRHFNYTIGYILLPVHFHALLVLIVVGNYTFIRLGITSGGFFVASIFYNVTCVTLLSLYKHASIYYKLSSNVLQSKRSNGKIWKKYLRSCSTISLEVGTLYKLTPSAIIRAISEVFTSLMSALILSNVQPTGPE